MQNEIDQAIELMNRAWQARYESIMSQPESKQQYLEDLKSVQADLVQAVSILRNANANRELVNALGKLGHLEMDHDRHDIALKLYEESVGICRNLGDDDLLAHAVRHLGDVQSKLGHDNDAEECYEESLQLYDRQTRPPTMDFANALRATAILKEKVGEFEQSQELWRRASDLYGQLGIQAGVDECSKHLFD